MYKDLINSLEKRDNVINDIVNNAQISLSKYRQGKQDLIARMATDWPEWSAALDFYTSFIHPLFRNSIVLNFINHSDKVDLSNMKIQFFFGFRDRDEKIKLKEFEETIKYNDIEKKADLIDYSIISVPEIEKKVVISAQNKEVKLVSVRDADIGVHAFFSLFEGIIRNSAKHKDKSRDNKDFIVKIIFWENLADLYDFIGKESPKDKTEMNIFSGVTITVSYDYFNKTDGKPRNILEQGKEKDIVIYLNEKMNEVIIDKTTGRMNPGHWGLKEIKACAAFLSGKKIQEVNSKKVEDYLLIDKTAKFWEDNEERLFYNIKLEKPRIILAVVPSDKLPTDKILTEWRSFGIGLVSSVELNNGTYNKDFNFFVTLNCLYDEKEKDEINKIIIDQNHKLPQRKVLNIDYNLDFSQPNKNNAFDFIKVVYDKWLEDLEVYSKQSNLIIYFDDYTTSNNWRNKWRIEEINEKIRLFFPNEHDWSDALDDINQDYNNYIIARHKKFDNIVEYDCQKAGLVHYFQNVSYSDLFFSFLMSINPETILSDIVLRQILESCYLKFLVIDERIVQTIENDLEKVSDLKKMNIDVCKEVKIYRKNDNGEKIGQNQFIISTKGDNDDNFVAIDFDDINSLSGYDVILVHATRLNEIFDVVSNIYSSKEQFIDDLKKNISNKKKFFNILVHSGRGKTEGDIPLNTPFLEYSIVQKYLIQEPSKFYLTQITLSVQ